MSKVARGTARLVAAALISSISGNALALPTACAVDSAEIWNDNTSSEDMAKWVGDHNRRTSERLRLQVDALGPTPSGEEFARSREWGDIYWTVGGRLYRLFVDDRYPSGLIQAKVGKSATRWRTVADMKRAGSIIGGNANFQGMNCLNAATCLVRVNDPTGPDSVHYLEFNPLVGRFRPSGLSIRSPGPVWWLDKDSVVFVRSNGRLLNSATNMSPSLEKVVRGHAKPLKLMVLPASVAGYEFFGNERITLLRNNDDGALWLLGRNGDAARVRPSLPLGQFAFKGDRVAILLSQDSALNHRAYRQGSVVQLGLRELYSRRIKFSLLFEPGINETATGLSASSDGFIVEGVKLASAVMWKLNRGGKFSIINVPSNSTIRREPAAIQGEEATLFAVETFASPARDFVLAQGGALLPLDPLMQANEHLTVQQFWAASSNRVRVPYYVVRSQRVKDLKDPPVLVHVYGGYGSSMTPMYWRSMEAMWLSRGGVYVVANVRGGSELGSDWRVSRAGHAATYVDLEAVLREVERSRLAAPRRIGLLGHSYGGHLVAYAYTHFPRLFGAAVIQSGVLNFCRPDWNANPKLQEQEFGSLLVPAEANFLKVSSPLQALNNVRPSFDPFVFSPADDPVVSVAHSRSFVRKLDLLSRNPYYYEPQQGFHGTGLSAVERWNADRLAFSYLWKQLGSE